MALTQEIEYYTEHLPEWLAQYAGRVVAVKDHELIGFFDTETEALVEGSRRYGLTSFLIRRVVPQTESVQVPALTLGILHANPERPIRG